MIRYVWGPPVLVITNRFCSGKSRNSVPYGVNRLRAPPEGLQRVYGSLRSTIRSFNSARAHGCNGTSLNLILPVLNEENAAFGLSGSGLSRSHKVEPAAFQTPLCPGSAPQITRPS